MTLSVRHWCWRLGVASFLALGEVSLSSGDYIRAQIIPDDTLGAESSILTPNIGVGEIPTDRIDGGARRGVNLFHSFREFNVGDRQRVFFSNPVGIENILSRVTGTNPSGILGTLGVTGGANLFLLNPNGIIFGPNAKLDLRGSFLGSTARSIKFADGTEFNAISPSDPTLLTINVPVGLQYGQDPGRILVQGQGNELRFDETGEVLEVIKTSGLAVESGQTLALAGGEVVLEGGSLSAESGQVELWSVHSESLLSLTPTNPGWALSDEGVRSFQNIRLSQAAAIDTSGSRGGKISIQGRRVVLQDGSFILSLTSGKESGENVTVRASESIEASGTAPSGQPSGLLTETTGAGNAGNVTINTIKLILRDGAQVSSSTYSQGDGGKISVNALELFEAIGINRGGNFSSGLFAISRSTGEGGIVEVKTGKLILRGGAQINAATYNKGQGGNVLVNALESVEAKGIAQIGPSGLFAGTLGAGDGGTVEVKTRRLSIQEGAQISSTTLNQGQGGNGGNVIINALETVELRGITQIGALFRSSGLFATSRNTGKGGTVTVKTGRLVAENGAQILTTAFAGGNGGNINIQASEVKLIGTADNGIPTTIFATTRGDGDGGEIRIETARSIVREGAQVGAGTFGRGRSGSVFVKASDSVELVGAAPEVPNQRYFRDWSGQKFPSGLFTGSQGTGAAGNLRIETDRLTLRDGAEIGVNNQGVGDAGNLEVVTRKLLLDNQAVLSATTTLGQGGNITLKIDDLLLLRRNSQISTTAGLDRAGGDGGNILIDSDLIVAVPDEDSDITANAFLGRGGKIDIKTQGLFGLEFRNFRTPLSDITASSEFGIAGVVNIDILDVDPAQSLTELPANIVDVSRLIGQDFCRVVGKNSEFVVTGRGGLPTSPNETLRANAPWEDLRLVDESKPTGFKLPSSARSEQPKMEDSQAERIVEAQGWITTPNGDVLLTAKPATVTPQGLWLHPLDCQLWTQSSRS
ncbi:filamentous hemagglutinin N-terminal domain-containing protein [Scytonema sp. UIC 10036]|uniref:beta strand repeat-containing protein n=1 Tax=Scytonema sp. UIC 10036 TaxID=2304196 RepID=UPI0012DADEE1|nr:S-layer family protein [Scytonema sp. UIC 10036]MUG97803.1 filamentous hemagglutinin N-terminal domain-containing protein [Scytonema sp. UIC 10036]